MSPSSARAAFPSLSPLATPRSRPISLSRSFHPAIGRGEVLGRVGDWLSAGTRLVWLIDPERRLARTYRADGGEEIVTAEQTLQGEDVVSGFVYPLVSI